jgi:hypothetical protein
MADVSVYKRCIETYCWTTQTIHVGDVRLGTDAACVANPQRWVTLTDADLTSGKKGVHDN